MAVLAGQRAQFTWAVNQYNKTDEPAERAIFARRMAKYIKAAPANGFAVEDVTQGQSYPADEVKKFLDDADIDSQGEISEEQAQKTLNDSVDTKSVVRIGAGIGSVYA